MECMLSLLSGLSNSYPVYIWGHKEAAQKQDGNLAV